MDTKGSIMFSHLCVVHECPFFGWATHVQSLSPCEHAAVTDAAITDKIQIPGESYIEVLAGNSSAITEYRTLSKYQNDRFIVLTLDKADTAHFSYNIII